MLAYAISLFVGEAIRDVQYAQVIPHEVNLLTVPSVDKRSRWFLYSGSFLLLKQRYRLPQSVLRQISRPLYGFSPNSCLPMSELLSELEICALIVLSILLLRQLDLFKEKFMGYL